MGFIEGPRRDVDCGAPHCDSCVWRRQPHQSGQPIELFTPEGDESLTILEELKDSFGRHDPFLIVASGDVFSPSYLNRLEVLHEEVSNLNLDLTTLDERRVDRSQPKLHMRPKTLLPPQTTPLGTLIHSKT